jgi:hypothetical protein
MALRSHGILRSRHRAEGAIRRGIAGLLAIEKRKRNIALRRFTWRRSFPATRRRWSTSGKGRRATPEANFRDLR